MSRFNQLIPPDSLNFFSSTNFIFTNIITYMFKYFQQLILKKNWWKMKGKRLNLKILCLFESYYNSIQFFIQYIFFSDNLPLNNEKRQ